MENNEVYEIVEVTTHSCKTCGAGLTFGESKITTCKYCGNEYRLVVVHNQDNGGSHEEIEPVEKTSALETVDKEVPKTVEREVPKIVNNSVPATVDRETHEIVEHKKLPLLAKLGIFQTGDGLFLIINSIIGQRLGYGDARPFFALGFMLLFAGWGTVSLSRWLENKNHSNNVSMQTAGEVVETGIAYQKKLG